MTAENLAHSQKIFGVGLARTGTTSLHQAMRILGVDSAPTSVSLLDGLDADFLSSHEAFFDNPVPFRYRELAEVCQNARWIVTQRPLDDWLTSMQWLFGAGLDRLDPATRQLGDRVHRAVYGTDTFDADVLAAVYTEHYDALRTWLVSRESVWIHVDRGFEWKPICELIDKPEPDTDFPHANARPRGFWRRRPQLRRRAKSTPTATVRPTT